MGNRMNCCIRPTATRYFSTVQTQTEIQTIKSIDEFDALRAINYDDIPLFTFKNYATYGKITNVYDGDTFTLVFLYNGSPMKYKCRCLGYDSPEMKPSLKSPNREKEIAAAKIARQRFIDITSVAEFIYIKFYDFDKYGRILVEVFIDETDEKSVNTRMIEEGHGYKYDGGKKQEFATTNTANTTNNLSLNLDSIV